MEQKDIAAADMAGVNNDERRARLARLRPRTRELVEMLVRRPDLSVVDVARLIGLAESNARVRLHREVYPPTGLDCEGRGHLTVEYRDVVGPEPTVSTVAGTEDCNLGQHAVRG